MTRLPFINMKYPEVDIISSKVPTQSALYKPSHLYNWSSS